MPGPTKSRKRFVNQIYGLSPLRHDLAQRMQAERSTTEFLCVASRARKNERGLEGLARGQQRTCSMLLRAKQSTGAETILQIDLEARERTARGRLIDCRIHEERSATGPGAIAL